MQTTGAQDQSHYIALITGIKGNVLLMKTGKPGFEKAIWGTQLFKGDQVKTEINSEVSLTFSDGTIIKLPSGRIFEVSGENPTSPAVSGNVRRVTSSMMADMSVLTTKKDNKKDAGALAGVRGVVTEEPIELTSPSNTLIKTDRPSFTWVPRKPFDKFVVNLYNSRGLVWSNKVSESTLKFPAAEKALEPGETYFWNVEGEDLLDNKKSASYKFSVLSFEKSKEIKDQEALIRKTFDNDSDSSSLHSFLGAFYLNQGLLQDAINEFEIISGMNPDAPLPHEILGSLYSDVGNKDKAIEELQKALLIAKSKEK
ncbi:MAG TPA: hypothetical protein DEO60_08130 [Bacteroidales bacterium]|nr:hypothetical protein [Bacteroidales bacterium]HBZ21079.1 hypothetical protein [Bacteroidales bacterium]